MKNLKRHSRGFSLIELLAGVLIIGIISNVAIPAYISQVKTSRGTVCNTSARDIATAVQGAYIKAGGNSYNASPMTDLSGTVTTDIGGTIPTNPCTSTNTVGASPNAWTITILGGGTGWKITPNDPNGKCSGLVAVQLGS